MACPEGILATPMLVRLDERDAGLLARIEGQCFSQPWSEAQFRQALQQKAFFAHAMLAQGRPEAYLTAYKVGEELEILNIAVLPQMRGRGLAKRLLAGVLHKACSLGVTASSLEVRESNRPAIGLYASFGYEPVGRRKGYYTSPSEDAIVYVLDLRKENQHLR